MVNAPTPDMQRVVHANTPEGALLPASGAPEPRVIRDYPERFSEEEKALIREQDAMLRRQREALK